MKIALIAGTGQLPPHVVNRLVAEGRAPVICEMRGFPSEVSGDFMRVPFRLETLGTLLETLKKLDITHVCMAGAVQRPAVDPSAIDGATAPLVPRLMDAMTKGDDGTLRVIISVFEEYGLNVLGAHQLAPDLLPVSGVLTKTMPPPLGPVLDQAQTALLDMGQRDLGQAMLLRGGEVIAREDTRGTAAMLNDFSDPLRDPSQGGGLLSDVLGMFGDAIEDTADWLSGDDRTDAAPGAGAVLYKAPKPDQSRLVDLPVIGPDTAMQAAEAGLAGIVIPVEGVMVLDLAQVVSILDAHDMFLWVHP